MTVEIHLRPSGSGETCRSILAELPTWFGMPASNAAYAEAAETWPTYVALQSGPAVGLLIPKTQTPDAVEIHLLAVRPSLHRSGVGRALVGRAAQEAHAEGASFLTVKTLGPSDGDPGYALTRKFYAGVGFGALEESFAIWGPEQPCLFMAMALRSSALPARG